MSRDSNEVEHLDEIFTGDGFRGLTHSGHIFENCVFRGCDLKEARFENSKFIECRFESCDLSNFRPTGSRFRQCVFVETKLIGVNWTAAADVINPEFTDSNLEMAILSGMKLKKSVFTGCNLRDADFSGTDLSDSDLRRSDFAGARFRETNLTKADLRGAVNYLIDPIANRVRGARFSLPEAQGLLAGLGVILES